MADYVTYEYVVSYDYGQFMLVGDQKCGCSADPEIMLRTALEGDGIAGDQHGLLVLPPHQNNFELQLIVEVWPHEPPDDLGTWEEAFVGSLHIGAEGLWWESPTLDGQELTAPRGHHCLRISGRGFVSRGWPGTTTPGDTWRIQIWPGDATPARRIARWDAPN